MTYSKIRVIFYSFLGAGIALLLGTMVCARFLGLIDMVTKKRLLSAAYCSLSFAMFVNAFGGARLGKIIGRGGTMVRTETGSASFNGFLAAVVFLGVLMSIVAFRIFNGSTPIRF